MSDRNLTGGSPRTRRSSQRRKKICCLSMVVLSLSFLPPPLTSNPFEFFLLPITSSSLQGKTSALSKNTDDGCLPVDTSFSTTLFLPLPQSKNDVSGKRRFLSSKKSQTRNRRLGLTPSYRGGRLSSTDEWSLVAMVLTQPEIKKRKNKSRGEEKRKTVMSFWKTTFSSYFHPSLQRNFL